MLIAKPVVDKQFWILKQDNQKVGNIQAVDNEYVVTMHNTVASYRTIPMLRKQAKIEFEPLEKSSKPINDHVHGFATGCKTYNGMWNVRMKVPLFTKQAKSKSWFAAGWYLVKQHRTWKSVHNPKLIVLERYHYHGPFHSKEQACNLIQLNNQPLES